jgi:hypothetical protein
VYRNLSDKEFLKLIFTSEDGLGMDYVEEVKVRRLAAVPFMCKVLTSENNYRFSDGRFQGVIHAIHLLGILGDSSAFDGFVSASMFSHKWDIDWIWDVLPECYLRLGKDVIAKLMNHIGAFKHDSDLVSEEITGLWNLWEAYPEEREGIEAFLLQVVKDPKTDGVTRANLIADFAQLGRRDLKPLFGGLLEKGGMGLDSLARDDLDYLFDTIHCPPTSHYDLEGFFSAEEIEAWQESSKVEN